MVPGCIRHCHFPDTSELLRNSFKLVSVRNMTSTLVWRWIRESHFAFVCTLINTHYNSIRILLSVKSHQKHITGKEGKQKCKETFGQRVYSQRKKCNDEIEGNHSSLKINETTNSKSKTQVVFYTFLSLSNNMAHSSTLLPLHLGLQVILVSSQRKEGKKKVLFS